MNRMQKAGKIAFWIIIIAVFFGVAYFTYESWWGTNDKTPVFARAWNTAENQAKKVAEYLKEKTGRTVNYVASGGVRYAREGAGNVVSSLGEGLQSLGGQIAGDASSSPGISSSTGTSLPKENIPSSSTTSSVLSAGFFSPPPFSALVSRVGENLSFSLNRESDFLIDWGDGSHGSGSVPSGQSVIIRHAWEREGDYEVSITIDDKKMKRDFSFPIRVYK